MLYFASIEYIQMLKTLLNRYLSVVIFVILAMPLQAKKFSSYGRVWYVDIPATVRDTNQVYQSIQSKLVQMKEALNTVSVTDVTLLFPLRNYPLRDTVIAFVFDNYHNKRLHLIGLKADLKMVQKWFPGQGAMANQKQNDFINTYVATTNMVCNGNPASTDFLKSSPSAFPTLQKTFAANHHKNSEFIFITNPFAVTSGRHQLYENSVNIMGLRFTDNTNDHVFFYNHPESKHPLYRFSDGDANYGVHYVIRMNRPYAAYLDNLILENMWASGFHLYGEITQSIHQLNREIIIEDNILQNIWGRNDRSVPSCIGILTIGMKDVIIRRNKVYNNLAVTKQLAGGIGLCGGCELNRNVLMENNEVCGFEFSFWLEGNSGGIELKNNRSIGTESGLVVSKYCHYVKDLPYTVNYVHGNYFSNIGLDARYNYYSAQYGEHQLRKMIFFDGGGSATEYLKFRNNQFNIDENNFIQYRRKLFDNKGQLAAPTFTESSERHVFYIGQHNLQFLCNTVSVKVKGTPNTSVLIPSNRGWFLGNSFSNLNTYDVDCGQKQGKTNLNNINKINSGKGPCATNTETANCDLVYANTQKLNGPFTLNYTIHDPCQDGSPTAFAYSVSGGTPGYTFQLDGERVGYPGAIDGTVMNLRSGNHVFTITDQNKRSASFNFRIEVDAFWIIKEKTTSAIVKAPKINFTNAKIFLDSDFTIDSDTADFTGCTIHLRPGGKIQVAPGKHVIFRNCLLTSACGEQPWEGVFAPNAKTQIRVENSTFQNVRKKIKSN